MGFGESVPALIARTLVRSQSRALQVDQETAKEFHRVHPDRASQVHELDNIEDTCADLDLVIHRGMKADPLSNLPLGKTSRFACFANRPQQDVGLD